MDDLAEVEFLPLGVGGKFWVLSCAVGWWLAGIEGLAGCFRLSGIWFVLSFPAFWWLT